MGDETPPDPGKNLTAARFPPGRSGNPGGRPKGLPRFRRGCREAAPQILARILVRMAEPGIALPDLVRAFESVCAHGGYLPADEQAAVDTSSRRLLLLALALKDLSPGQRDQLVGLLREQP